MLFLNNIIDKFRLACAKHKPLVSVIVASYNYEQFIEETLCSILEQTYKNLEVVVVDDGSKDSSVEIIKRIQATDRRVKLLQHNNGENKGLPATVRLGVENAAGEYIAFCESDDYWHPDMLRQKILFVNKHPEANIISNNIMLVGEECSTHKVQPYINDLYNKFRHNEANRIELDANFDCNHIPTFSCIMVRAYLLRGLDYNPTKPAWLDLWLWQQILKDNALYYIPAKLTYWRIHGDSYNYKDIGIENDKERFVTSLRKLLAANVNKEDSVEQRIKDDCKWLEERTLRYNASIETDGDRVKMEYTLLRENHVIEKGLSMQEPKKGFGVEKVSMLLDRLEQYYVQYGEDNTDFIHYPLSTIRNYIEYTKRTSDIDISQIEKKYEALALKLPVLPDMPAGVLNISAEAIRSEAQKDFRSLLQSRHSIRYFKPEPPAKEILEEALKLASQTPSACNRQAWRTHIYVGKDCGKLLRWQGGSRGLEDKIPCCIIVTADMKAFLEHEVFQAYVDGGLYAMNLINALHYLGLGTIPLSLGFHRGQLQALVRYNIADNETPIVIIGTGYMYDTFRIAVSKRKRIEYTNSYEYLEDEHTDG